MHNLFNITLHQPLDCMEFMNMTVRQFLNKVMEIHVADTSQRTKLGELDEVDSLNTTMQMIESPVYPGIFDLRALIIVIIYSFMFIIATIGNLKAFYNLFRSRRRKSAMSLMMIHLTIADLVVTFIMLPFEISWRITMRWLGGDFGCKVLLFFRAFGLYLSSNVLICISCDRYLAIIHPMMVSNKRRRGKWMLAIAWFAATLYALPQLFVFHVEQHPFYSNFSQCVSFDYFTSHQKEFAYNLSCLIVMYFLPLLVIIYSYSSILWKMWHKSSSAVRRHNSDASGRNLRSESETRSSNTRSTYAVDNSTDNRFRLANRSDRVVLRRSDMQCIERAKIRTLKMTIVIVIVFLVCWTPYVVMALWYLIDKTSASNVPLWLQDSLFLMAVANSCMNPFVYRRFAIKSSQANRALQTGEQLCCIWYGRRIVSQEVYVRNRGRHPNFIDPGLQFQQ